MKNTLMILFTIICVICYSQSKPDTSLIYYFIPTFEEDSTLFYTNVYTYDNDGLLKETHSNFYYTSFYNGVSLKGEFIYHYFYDNKHELKESIILNSKNDTVVKESYTLLNENDLEYVFYRNENNTLKVYYRYYYYNIRNKDFSDYVNEILRLLNSYDAPYYYYADSILFEKYNQSTSQYDRKKIYFNYFPDGRVISCLQEDYHYNDKLLFDFSYDTLLWCTKVEITKIIPDSCTEKYLYYTKQYNKNGSIKEIALYPIPNNCFNVSHFYGEKDIYLYDEHHRNNGIITMDADSNNVWLPIVSTYYKYKSNHINDFLCSKLQMYPNPANEYLTIENENIPIEEACFYNLMGQKVKQIPINSSKAIINTQDLKQGMYIVKIQTEHGVLTRKVQVIR